VKKKVVFEYPLIFLITIVLSLAQTVCSAPEHCGLLSEGNLCRINDNTPILSASSFSILSASDFDNDIFLNPCQKAEYVSDGNNWISCLSGQYILQNIGAHDYFCNGTKQREEQVINDVVNITTGNGLGSIIECCGSSLCLCNSNNAGVRLTTGQSLTVDGDIPEITLVCPDNQHLIGLDVGGNIICEESISFLVGSLLTPADCINDGGEVVNIGQGSICKFSGDSCPTVWTQFENFRTTVPSGNCPRQENRVVSVFNINAKYQITDSGTYLISCNYGSILCCGPAPTNIVTTGQEFSSHEPDKVTFTQGKNACGAACGAEHCTTTTAFCEAKTIEIGCH